MWRRPRSPRRARRNATIVVSVPGKDEDDLADKIGQTAQLSFRPVQLQGPGPGSPLRRLRRPRRRPLARRRASPQRRRPSPSSPSPSPSASASAAGRLLTPALTAASASPSASPSASAQPVRQPVDSASQGPAVDPANAGRDDRGTAAVRRAIDCADPANAQGFKDDPDQDLVTCDRDGTTKYLLAPAAVRAPRSRARPPAWTRRAPASGRSSSSSRARAPRRSRTSRPSWSTTRHPTNQFAIVLDGLVVSAPYVHDAIVDGNAQITGSFTKQEAKDLANLLKYGALPLAFETGEVQTISPTLGSDQLQAGLVAGALGLFLVVLYSLLYYRGLGIVTVPRWRSPASSRTALIVYLGQTIGFTLTLAGIAGTIVAIGITADSFIVFFERLRDEVREGEPCGSRSRPAGPGATHDPRRRRGVDDRGRGPLLRVGRSRTRLRVHPRPHDPHRRVRGVPVHQAAHDPARPHHVLRQGQQVVRSRPRTPRADAPSRRRRRRPDVPLHRRRRQLYRGEVSYDFVGHRRRWYALSGVILLLSIGALLFRGLDLGIEFEGGAVFGVPTATGRRSRPRTRPRGGVDGRDRRHRHHRAERALAARADRRRWRTTRSPTFARRWRRRSTRRRVTSPPRSSVRPGASRSRTRRSAAW